jgi:Na+/H+ antiporter NhaD/arsenite permease-like protein
MTPSFASGACNLVLVRIAQLGTPYRPIRAAPTGVALTLIHKLGTRLSFVGFVTKTLIFAILQLILASLCLAFVMLI